MFDRGGIRRLLAGIFLFGSVGTGAELLLLDHVEDAWQMAPLVLIGVACGLLALVALRPSPGAIRLFQLTMVAFVLSGVAGMALHYQGNVEFELELQPDASGLPLVWESLKGATPALAPGTMMLLGALGLTCTSRQSA
jgi:hypothetical protein